jgi:hypothetical protein
MCDGTCTGATASYDTRIRIYPPDCGAALTDNDDFCSTRSQIGSFRPTVSGLYIVEVTGYQNNSVGSYVLGYHIECPDFGDCSRPNGTLPVPTTSCQNITSNMACATTRAYNITLTQGQTYSFTTCDGTCAGAGSQFDSAIELYRGGQLVASNTAACGGEGALSSEIVYTADELTGGGEYCVQIRREAGSGAYSLGYRVACQEPSSLVAGPSARSTGSEACGREQTFVVHTAGTGPFDYEWTVTPIGMGTATPATETHSGVSESVDRFTAVLGPLGQYQVTVKVSNECGEDTTSFTFTLGDARAPNIVCSAVEKACDPVTPANVGANAYRVAPVSLATGAAASQGSRSALEKLNSVPRPELARLLMGARSTEAARRAIADRLAVPPRFVSVRDEPPRRRVQALTATGLGCATPCTSGNLSASHPYYDVFLACASGAFSARTGASHSVTLMAGTRQNVIFGGSSGSTGTSDITLRVHNNDTSFLNPPNGAACPFDPPDTPAEPASVGVEAEWQIAPLEGLALTLREEVVAFGATEDTSGVRLTMTVTNAPSSTLTANVGLRWQIDYQNSNDDGPGFSWVTCNPFSIDDETFREHEFLRGELSDFYRIRNNTGSPIFGNFTSVGPILGFPGTAVPDRFLYGDWPSFTDSAWNFQPVENRNADGDSATLIYYGYLPENGLRVEPGEMVSRSVVIFTAGQTQSCQSFVPGDATNAEVSACKDGCVELGATATDTCSSSSVVLLSTSENAPPCIGNPCTPVFDTPGTHTYTFEATDGYGNKSTCTTTVTVTNNSVQSCDDGDFCNGQEVCSAGACGAGRSPTCDDGLACTADSCDPITGCASTLQPGFCLLDPGVCVPAGTGPSDVPCLTCDPTQSTTTYSPRPNGTPCSDGNVCNGGEQCQGGQCMPGTPLVCDDGKTCTTDTCDPVSGCQATLQPGFCLIDGVCIAAGAGHPTNICLVCDPAQSTSAFSPRPNGTSCADNDVCNGAETCQSGACQPGTALVCNDGKTCTTNSCDATTGCKFELQPGFCLIDGVCIASGTGHPTNPCLVCDPVQSTSTYSARANGTDCSDGDVCNGHEQCQNGQCVAGTPLVCQDGKTCTTDSCDPILGCEFTLQEGFCIIEDACLAAGTGHPSNRCLVCDPAQSTSAFSPRPNGTSCADNDVCNGAETCQNGACQPGTSLSCNDGKACTTDSCDATTGCKFDLQPGFCLIEGVCIASGTGHPKNPCLVCDPVQSTSMYSARVNGTDCSDGNVCNGAETCQNGQCAAGTPLSCDDGKPCTEDFCDPVSGCQSTLKTGHCLIAGECVASGGGHSTNACLVCDPSQSTSAFSPRANGTSCSDNNVCNGMEMCQNGACTPGTALTCDDGKSCTSDSCDALTGCKATLQPGFCLIDGACVAAGTVHPTNLCLACDPSQSTNGFSPRANGTQCGEGDLCSGVATCSNGVCAPGTPVECHSPPECRSEIGAACNPQTGECEYPALPNGSSCSDGNPCNGVELCQGGACVAGTPIVCDSPPACRVATGATCNPSSGACVYPAAPDGTACDDGDACNGAETCSGGACMAGVPLACNDSNPCTTDSCDPGSGCVHAPVAACVDGGPPPEAESHDYSTTGTSMFACSVTSGSGGPAAALPVWLAFVWLVWRNGARRRARGAKRS